MYHGVESFAPHPGVLTVRVVADQLDGGVCLQSHWQQLSQHFQRLLLDQVTRVTQVLTTSGHHVITGYLTQPVKQELQYLGPVSEFC